MELNIHRTRILLRFGFPASLALLFLCTDGGFLLRTLSVCFLHELGHGIAMLLTGAGIREIHLHAAGIRMRTAPQLLSKWQELLILLSGPAMNLLAAALLFLRFGCCEMASLHLCMGIFNLLPYSILDGGAVISCLADASPHVHHIRIAICVMLSLGISALLACQSIRNPILYLMLLYLAVSELRVDKQGGMW